MREKILLAMPLLLAALPAVTLLLPRERTPVPVQVRRLSLVAPAVTQAELPVVLPGPGSRPPPRPPATPVQEQGGKLYRGAVREAVSVYVAASLREDRASREAIFSSLRRDPAGAREVVREMIRAAESAQESSSLREILGRLP